jgi:hypothetical protein
MSAEIVNLNKARKAKARADKETTAAHNRAKFGRTKAERLRETAEDERRQRELDGARRPVDPDRSVPSSEPEQAN